MPSPQHRPFVGTDVAARIERTESRMVAGGAAGAARRDPAVGAFAQPIAGGVACWAGAGSPLNKIAGLGFGGALPDAELAALESAYDALGAPVQVELASLGEPAIGLQLSRRGYELVGHENVLVLALDAESTTAVETDARNLQVEESPPGEMPAWLDTLVSGFASPDPQGLPAHEDFPRAALEQVLSDMASASGFRRYEARLDGVLAGGGSLYIGDGVALLCGAATLPQHRRRGVQHALLRHRLRAALAAGCELAAVTTQPGSKSQENVHRLGFELAYVRAILVRPARPAT